VARLTIRLDEIATRARDKLALETVPTTDETPSFTRHFNVLDRISETANVNKLLFTLTEILDKAWKLRRGPRSFGEFPMKGVAADKLVEFIAS
jgi:hypothetical protein